MTPYCIAAVFVAAVLLTVKLASDAERNERRRREDDFAAATVGRLAARQEGKEAERSLPRRLVHWWEA